VFRVLTTVNLLLPTPVCCKSNNDVIVSMKAVKSRMTRTDYPYTKRQGLYGINPTVPYAVSMIYSSRLAIRISCDMLKIELKI